MLARIYPDQNTQDLVQAVKEAFWPEGAKVRKRPRVPSNGLFSPKDSVLITYGDSLLDGSHKPLDLFARLPAETHARRGQGRAYPAVLPLHLR